MVLARAMTTLTRLTAQAPPDRLSDVSTRLPQVHQYLRAGPLEPSEPHDPLPA
jgi:hypothetical protein